MMRHAIVALILCLTACGGPGPVRDPAVRSDPYAMLLRREDLRGRPVARAVEGRPVTLVVVFATWCRPCRHELALLRRLAAEDESIAVVGLNAYEDWNDLSSAHRMREYLAEAYPELTVVRSDDELMKALGGVPKIPSLFVFDRAGTLVAAFRRHERPPPGEAELRQVIEKASRRDIMTSE